MTQKEQVEAADHRRDAVLARVRALTPMIRDGAAAAEEARTLPREIVDALLAAGITRILIPPRYGGYGLGLDTWFEVVREIAKADASHGWCASLMIHHPHYVGHFPRRRRRRSGPTASISRSRPRSSRSGRVTPVEGGYRISGEFPFASGINHSRWLIVGSMAEAPAVRRRNSFSIGPNEFKIKDTWFTAPCARPAATPRFATTFTYRKSHTLALSDLREGKTPGGKLHDHPIYRAPWISYAPLTFTAPMLGAAQGAYELFRDWTKTRRAGRAAFAIAEVTSVQVRLARAAADLDAAELLLRRVGRRCPRAEAAVIGAACAHHARLFARRRILRRCRRHVDRHERHRRLCRVASDPARLARHPFRRHARCSQSRAEFLSFRPRRTWTAARSAFAVL